MPVALEKSVEIRSRLVDTINGNFSIDEFTARKIKLEIEREKSYSSKLMLNSLLSVALKKYRDAYSNFESYVNRCDTFDANSDYLTFLTQVNDYKNAYDKSIVMHERFGKNFGAAHLKQLYNVFRAVSDLSMMKVICDDLETIQAEEYQSTRSDAEGFIEHCRDFCGLVRTDYTELKNVLLVAYDVVKEVKINDVNYSSLDVDQVLYYRMTTEEEFGVTMTIKGISTDYIAELASDMNLMLVEKLISKSALPQGSWSLWFEPQKR